MRTQNPILKEQLGQNIDLARQMGVYDRDTFPTTLPREETIVPWLERGAALVVAKTVQGVGLIGETHGEKSLVANYRNLGQGNDERLAGSSVREWGGSHFAKTQRFSPVHDRGVTTPYHVAIVGGGFAEGIQTWPAFASKTLGFHRELSAIASLGGEGILARSTMTISQYMTLSALRAMRDLSPLRGKTRLPHYPVRGVRFYENVPVISSTGNVIEMGSEGDGQLDRVGIRVVVDVSAAHR